MSDKAMPEGITEAERAAYEDLRTDPAKRLEAYAEGERLHLKRAARRVAEEEAGIRTGLVKTEDGV